VPEGIAEKGKRLVMAVNTPPRQSVPAGRRPEQLHQREGGKGPPAGSAQHLPHQQKRAGHRQIRLKRPARLLPPDAQPPKMPQPGLPAGRQATVRSTTHRRRYRSSDRPSRLRFSGRRLLRCGAISSMPRAANDRSRASLSQAISATTRSGTSLVSMKSNNPCARVDSCGRPEQLCTATGNPRASTAMRILTPLPTFVRPIPSPPPPAGQNAASRKHSYSRYSPAPPPVSPPPARAVRIHPPAPDAGTTGARRSWSRTLEAGPSIRLRCPATRRSRPEPCACRFGNGRPWGSWEDRECVRKANPATCLYASPRHHVTTSGICVFR